MVNRIGLRVGNCNFRLSRQAILLVSLTLSIHIVDWHIIFPPTKDWLEGPAEHPHYPRRNIRLDQARNEEERGEPNNNIHGQPQSLRQIHIILRTAPELCLPSRISSLTPTDPDKTNEGISIIPCGKIAARNIVRLGDNRGAKSKPRMNPLNIIVMKLGAPNPNPDNAVAIETSQLLRKISIPRTGSAGTGSCASRLLPWPGW